MVNLSVSFYLRSVSQVFSAISVCAILWIFSLICAYSQGSKTAPLPPAYQFLENFLPGTFLFHTPRLLNFEKSSSQDIFKSRP